MAIGDVGFVDPIERAGRVLRGAPEPGWDADSIVAVVRGTPRGGWPLTVVDPDPDGGPGTIAVTDRALKASLINVMRDDPDYAVGAIDVVVEHTSLLAVRLELTGRYGTDLHAAANRAMARCARVVDDVIGASAAVPIEVVVTDVHR